MGWYSANDEGRGDLRESARSMGWYSANDEGVWDLRDNRERVEQYGVVFSERSIGEMRMEWYSANEIIPLIIIPLITLQVH